MPNEFSWNGGSGSWSTPTNWNPVGVPGSSATRADDVVISSPSFNGNDVTVGQPVANALFGLTLQNSQLNLGSVINLNVNGSLLLLRNGQVYRTAGRWWQPAEISLSGDGSLSGLFDGFGTVSEASGPFSGGGQIIADFGTLDIRNTISNGPVLFIGTSGPTVLKIDGTAASTAAIEIGNKNQTLEIGATGTLSIGSLQLVTNGTIRLDGGSLTDASGIVIGTGASLIGNGSVTGPLVTGSFAPGLVEASGGTLELTGDILPGAAIDPGSILKLNGAVASGSFFTFLGSNGEVAYNHAGPITANIYGLNVGASATDPTNFLDFKNHPVAIVGSNAHTGTDGTLQLSDGSILTLSGVTGSNSGTWFVDTKSDGSSGTDIFLSNTAITTSPPPEIWFQHTSGQLAVWQMNGTALVGGGGVGPNPGQTWFAMGKGALYTGDRSDVVWQNQNGPVVVWQVQGTQVVGGALVGDPGPTWHIEGIGDVNNDGHSDIVFQNDDGSVAIWEMNGASASFIGGGGVANPGPTWHIKGTGDFNGDGHSDILWQNDNGAVAIWEMNGTSFIGGGGVANPGPDWHIKGTGDVNDDGHTDIVFQNDNGLVAIWEMNGTSFIGGGGVANPGPDWHIKATGDFNNDSHTDIAFQNDNGAVAIWEMNGANFIGGGGVGNPGTEWNEFDDNMRFIHSASANETLTAAAPTPDEFVFTSFAAGMHTIAEFNPVQDMIEFSKVHFASFTDVQAATSAITGGAMINLGNGSSLLLPGVDPASLHASNFALA